MNQSVRQMRKQLIAAIAMVLVSALTLFSSTYAWYVANATVHGTTSTISAMTNGFILQIVEAGKPLMDGGSQASLSASTLGHEISPSSTDDMTNWWVVGSFDAQEKKVNGYYKPTFSTKIVNTDIYDGSYPLSGNATAYAYVTSAYTLYTLDNTGSADVYLDGSAEGGAIQVTVDGQTGGDKITQSMRVGICVDGELKLVYAPVDETGKGNDATGASGWSCVANATQLKSPTYPHIAETTYTDNNGKNWAVTKTATGDYELPTGADSLKIAENVGTDGTLLRVYIWLEGTDEQCVNSAESITDASYSVTLQLAGVSTTNP